MRPKKSIKTSTDVTLITQNGPKNSMNILAVYWNIRQCNAETMQFHKYRWIYNGHCKYVFGEILLTASVAVILKTNTSYNKKMSIPTLTLRYSFWLLQAKLRTDVQILIFCLYLHLFC